jgi:hypothetical protein
VILLPDANGLPSGEIVVATAMGEVVLNKPYQSTVTTVWEQVPTKTVILDLTVDLIDNLLIISPPKENEELQQTEGQSGDSDSSSNLLDIDFLADDSLNIDYLAEYGNDPSTQITTFGDAEKITLIRQVTQYVQLDLDGETGYNIIIEQDGKAYNIILNSASNTVISIRQGSG